MTFYRSEMTKTPTYQLAFENIVIAVGVAVILIALGLWLRSSAETWSLATLSFVCLTTIGTCLIIAGLVDRRDAACKAE